MHLESHKVHQKPFRVHVFDGVLETADQLDRLRSDVEKCVKLKRKDNDLYRFAQSKDLRSQLKPRQLAQSVHHFVHSIATQLRKRLQQETSIELSEQHLDVTVSRYKLADYLLCHNDHLKYGAGSSGHRRALAFVYYLTRRRWQVEKDGGALALYEADSAGEPVRVGSRISPHPNRLVVFEVGHLSWHAVEEVLCSDDQRLSINGWFHTTSACPGEPPNSTDPCPSPLYRPQPVSGRVESFFKECVNQQYLSNQTCALVRRRFKRDSEINLLNFLLPQKYKQISASLERLTKQPCNLTQLGPYSKRHYQTIKLDTLPPLCQDLYQAFRSELFYLMLARLTGLDLEPPTLADCGHDSSPQEASTHLGGHSGQSGSGGTSCHSQQTPPLVQSRPAAPLEHTGARQKASKRKKISDPLARFEFRHFQHGSYTLVHDHSFELAEKAALDVMLHFNHDFDVNFQDGGFISYIDGSAEQTQNEADHELLTVEPKSNCLSLVYRADQGTCRFVKHINKSHQADYQDLSCSFYERTEDAPSQAIISTD